MQATSQQKKKNMKKYNDTKEGALNCLRDESTIELPDDNNKIVVEPDPCVEGVWKVNLDPNWNDGDDTVIVYLSGFKDPFGVIREFNDWETGTSVVLEI